MGLPQGSIISVTCTLVSIKINSLSEVLRGDMHGSLYVERQLQIGLSKIKNCAGENSFKFSKTKTACVHYCTKRKRQNDSCLH